MQAASWSYRVMLGCLICVVAWGVSVSRAATDSKRAGPGAVGARGLVIATPSDAITVHPFEASVTMPDAQIVRNVYDALVELDRDGTVRPALATSWERVSDTILRFQLRRGVRFQNGEELTAEDVRFTFHTLLDPTKRHKAAATQSYVERVEVIDPYTVQIVTKAPTPLALRRLYRQGIASATYARANPEILATRPNGTGSYRFVEWVKDDHLTLEGFEGGWRGAPAVKRVVWRAIKEDAARVAALVAGEIDVAHSLPTDLVPVIERHPGVEARIVAGMRSYWLMMVNTRADLPTAKREVRQAINHAINRDELNRALFGGRALVMATAIHPKSLGYTPALRWPYDPARARELLARAGYPQGFTIGLHASDGRYARDRELSHALAGQLAAVGITVRVRNLEVGQFTDGIFKKTTDPLVLYAFSDADRDRTSNFSVSHHTGQLWSVFSYPRLDELIVRAERSLEDEDRARVLRETQDWMMENAPAAYLLTFVDIYGVRKALRWEPRPDEVLSWREASWSER